MIKTKISIILYRYEDKSYNNGFRWSTSINLIEIPVEYCTNRSYLLPKWCRQKYVLKNGKRLYAYDTKEKALNGYVARKHKQLEHARNNLNRVENVVKTLEDYLETNSEE